MSQALVPLFPGRPVWVRKDDWTVCVSVHDAYVVARYAELRAALLVAHPDGPTGSRTAWLRALTVMNHFVTREQVWYRWHGIAPPIPLTTRLMRVARRPSSVELQTRAALAAWPAACITVRELAAALDRSDVVARNTLQILERRGLVADEGFVIIGRRRNKVYRILRSPR